MSEAAVAQQTMSLTSLVEAGAKWADVAAFLDGLDAEGRVREIRALPGRLQAKVWTICADATPLTIDEFVPAPAADGQTVIWAGKNSLPMFTWFEKRFTRQGGKVVGYNHQTMSWFTGPGYFTLAPTSSSDRVKEVLFDYTTVPATAPSAWPAPRPNSAGFSKLVYNNLHDVCRRVSREVVIGEATRMGKRMESYFLLART